MKSGWTSYKNAAALILAATLLVCGPLLAQGPAVRATIGAADHLQQGMRLARGKKWAEAEREFRIAHRQDPDSTDAEVGHAEALVKIGQPFDAVLELQSFVRDHPDAARAHEIYAVVTLSTSNDFLLAQSEMEQTVKLAPNSGMAWKSLGDIYLDHTSGRN